MGVRTHSGAHAYIHFVSQYLQRTCGAIWLQNRNLCWVLLQLVWQFQFLLLTVEASEIPSLSPKIHIYLTSGGLYFAVCNCFVWDFTPFSLTLKVLYSRLPSTKLVAARVGVEFPVGPLSLWGLVVHNIWEFYKPFGDGRVGESKVFTWTESGNKRSGAYSGQCHLFASSTGPKQCWVSGGDVGWEG